MEEDLEAQKKLLTKLTLGLMRSGVIPARGWKGIRDQLVEELKNPSKPPPPGEPVIVVFTKRGLLVKLALRYPESSELYCVCDYRNYARTDSGRYILEVFKTQVPHDDFEESRLDALSRLSDRFLGLQKNEDGTYCIRYQVVFEEE